MYKVITYKNKVFRITIETFKNCTQGNPHLISVDELGYGGYSFKKGTSDETMVSDIEFMEEHLKDWVDSVYELPENLTEKLLLLGFHK